MTGSDLSGAVTTTVGACIPQEEGNEKSSITPGIRAFQLSPGSKQPRENDPFRHGENAAGSVKQEQHRSTAKQRGKDALLSSSTGRKQLEVEILEMTEEIEAKLKIKTSGTREAKCRTGYGSSGDVLQGHDALSGKESKEEKSATEKGLIEAEKLREESSTRTTTKQ